MKHLVIIFSILFLYACTATNHNGFVERSYDTRDMPTGPGCFAKCLIPDQYAETPFPIIEYIGDDYDNPNVRKDTLILKEARQVWEKRKNQEGIPIWCLKDEPGQFIDYYTLVDTSLSKDFVINHNFEKEIIVKKGGYTDWQQVVCDNDISPRLYSDIYDALVLKGYASDSEIENRGTIEPIRKPIVQYQKDHDLPIGQLNLETIAHLGVKI